ncbi:tetratricopeptide repeat protein [Novosphingobium album (ex Liu et al. 2023)]|uniref:Tetratricopeptide repeat protein n=1 Tax=Novosphingobium album (ex Liu et al. 2023) TaxID=3031130 RepID=A0ABT5WLP8_9SPHN|nr:tetratricopeptide repeat protein [Novosphingobium album (ex Liu et al. 2023)]MDE8650956.1 tetratricopeptide repeat protein [Novosphingobium album (ex Liu et al. 2023)]
MKPVTPPPAPAKADEAPVRILLSDQQVALERGQQTVYSETTLKIQTPQGLAAGNISLPWRPDTDVLTVHKLLIRRGDQTIDVLKSGQTFTVLRREQNLESATLDGVLTANIQPEGLQVGDTLEIAMSVSSSDPTLRGHVEQIAGVWNGFPIGRAHLRIQWPTNLPVRVRQTASLPELKATKTGNTSTVELSLDNVEPIVPPKGAPPRYRIGRLVEVTDYAAWADLGALMAPLYEKAATIPVQGPLQSELERIQSLSPDPRVRTEAALALVQDRVRYVALAMGAGGYVPADAETTWSRRYGDCKGKTALLLALLHAMGIEAEPVAVSTTFGDGLDARLPMVGLFNHVLVRASVAGNTYWLDGTRTGDTSLDRLTIPNFGWGLPLLAKDAALVRMVPTPLATPTQDVSIRIDASKGISAPAPTTVETIMRGDEAIGANAALANLVGEARDRALKDYWKDQYDFIDVKTASASFDQKAGELRLSMTGEAKLDWANGNYQTDGTNVGYRADFGRDPGVDKDAPFAVPYPYFTRTRETIVLPKGAGEFKIGTGMEVDETAGGIEYRRHASIAGGVFTIEKTERSVVAEFPAKEASAHQAALRMLDDRPASVRMPAGYKYSGSDISAIQADVPTTSSGYVSRAKVFINRGMRKEALLDYDKAVELDPNNVYAWANRGITRVQVGDLAGARSDLAKAEAIDPAFVQNGIGRGMLADVERRPQDAVEAYTRALEQEPDNRYAIEHRAAAYTSLGDTQSALADLTSIVEKRPDDPDAYIARGNFLLNQQEYDKAIADFDKAHSLDPSSEWLLANRGIARVWKRDFAAAATDLDAAAKINPKNAVVYRARGLMSQQKGAWQDAIAAYTSALQLEPDNGFALGHRAEAARAAGDDEAALRDAAAAIKQQPGWIDLYLLRANLFRGQGREAEALAEAKAVTAANPDNNYAHVVAANIYSAFHQDAEAMRAYDKAIALKPEAYIYLNRSLRRPKTDLAGRRADLDAALKLDPNFSEAISQKANLQAENGDLTGAISTYSAALQKSPDDLALLLGRGIAFARSGDAAHADADFQRARGRATEAVIFNNMCWAKATAGVALESALADCEAALTKAPDVAGYLDSRGLVLLRLGRLDGAISDYDRALAKSPNLPTSLFGRAVAWARKGDRAKSEADLRAALSIDPDIRTSFETYGVKLP